MIYAVKKWTIAAMENNEVNIEIPGYRILRQLGKGGMATVYLAIQEGFEREVALKVMLTALTVDDDHRRRFEREAKIVGQLSHPHIVPVYDVGYHNGHFYLAMECLKCGDLKQRIKQRLTPTQALTITKQIAQALGFSHRQGFIHRDVKPDNILFRDDDTAVLTDFGIARTEDPSSDVTAVRSIIGTPHYMSPEQALGETLDAQTDIYSLGVVLYKMLTGEVPFTGTNIASISVQHASQPVPLLAGDLVMMQPLVNSLLAKSKGERIQHAADVCTAIDVLQEDLAAGGKTRIHKKADNRTTARFSFSTTHEMAPTKSRPWSGLILVGLILSLIAGLTVYYLLQRPSGGSEVSVTPTEATTINVISPTSKEYYAFVDALESKNLELSRRFLKRFPNSPLGNILAVKALNEAERVPKLQESANAGTATAQLTLSELTDNGWGVEQDKKKAQKLAKQSAEHGYSIGEFQYAVLLLENEPTSKEVREAIDYLTRAADNGYFLAETRLGLIYLNGEHVKQNVDKGVQYLSSAAAQGDRAALFYLGRVYDGGIGLPADSEKAKEHFQQAADLGHQGAAAYLK